MKQTISALALVVCILTNCLVFAPKAGTTPVRFQTPDQSSAPYVQVTSVTVEPTAIHASQNPRIATIVAQILLWGQPPTKPEATVEVGTYSSDPPNIELKYETPTRTIPLRKGVTVVKFTVEAAPKAAQGKAKVAVTIGGATKRINIKDSEPKDFLAELTISDP